jgi:hypothetical protein
MKTAPSQRKPMKARRHYPPAGPNTPRSGTKAETTGVIHTVVTPKDPLKIRPGIIFHDADAGYGPTIVTSVQKDNVHSVDSNGLYMTRRLEEVEKLVNDEQSTRAYRNPFAVFADYLPALFELHPMTAPFAPSKQYRDIPIAPTPAGNKFIKRLLKLANFDAGSDWNSDQILEELESRVEGDIKRDELLCAAIEAFKKLGNKHVGFSNEEVLGAIKESLVKCAMSEAKSITPALGPIDIIEIIYQLSVLGARLTLATDCIEAHKVIKVDNRRITGFDDVLLKDLIEAIDHAEAEAVGLMKNALQNDAAGIAVASVGAP